MSALSIEEPARPGRHTPGRNWLIGCGGCGLLAVVVFIGVALFMKSRLEKAQDPERVWPLLQSVLPFDERPKQVRPLLGIALGGTTISLQDTRNEARVDLLAFGPGSEGAFDALFDAEKARTAALANASPLLDAAAGELEVQGRKVRTLHGRGLARSADASGAHAFVSKLRIDLSSSGGRSLSFQYELPDGDAATLGAAALAFLSEFDVWRGR
ncbi:MAG: hypothetical protein FJ299_02040 [Planctomycetes bacterium]|nr:hypothetical protein [Planctomycetota bacterium]